MFGFGRLAVVAVVLRFHFFIFAFGVGSRGSGGFASSFFIFAFGVGSFFECGGFVFAFSCSSASYRKTWLLGVMFGKKPPQICAAKNRHLLGASVSIVDDRRRSHPQIIVPMEKIPINGIVGILTPKK